MTEEQTFLFGKEKKVLFSLRFYLIREVGSACDVLAKLFLHKVTPQEKLQAALKFLAHFLCTR